MLGEVLKNPDLLKQYNRDKEQLKYEDEVLQVLLENHNYLKYVHPAILLKNAKAIIEEFGNFPKITDTYRVMLPSV